MNELKQNIHRRVLDYLDLRKRADLREMSDQCLREEAQRAVEAVMRQHFADLPTHVDRTALIDEVVAEAVGFGAIEPWLADPAVSEIMVNGPQQIFVEQNGCLREVHGSFTNARSLLGVIERIVAPIGRRIDESSPMVDARLPDGSRVNAIIPPIALDGPILTIRKFSSRKITMTDWINWNSVSPAMADFLKICVTLRKNIIISGGTGSGKTTLLNALSDVISPAERIVTIEDAAELKLAQTHVVRLEARPANMEGKGTVPIRDLVKNALRMRPDRIVVGECRGGEALDMLQAMNTGHDGSMTTGHANSPRDFLARLEVMVMMSGVELPSRAIREQIASAVDIIIQVNRFADGSRRVTQVVEVNGMEGDTLLLQPVFEFRRQGVTSEGKVCGEFCAMGYAPQFYEQARDTGMSLDFNIFNLPERSPELDRRRNYGYSRP